MSPKFFIRPTSIFQAYSGLRSGFGTTTIPGADSKTFPASSRLGALNPVDAFTVSSEFVVSFLTMPAEPVSAPLPIDIPVKGNSYQLLSAMVELRVT
jgi:hypothetical protein